jgi:plasmid stabilization system protein ParE
LATLIYADEAIADLWRLVDFLAETDLHAAYDTFDVIKDAVSILRKHPLIGRPAENGLRELVISRGRTGYVALYDYVEQHDLVSILSIRHQRELGYTRTH